MKKKLMQNWGLKLASLLLAFLLWFLVVQIDDPNDTVSFSNVKVNLTNTELLDQENKVYEVLDNTDVVRVTVRAPRSVLQQLRATDIVAEADISKITDINTIAISYSVQNASVDSIESIVGNHDVVRLNVEDRTSKWVRLAYNQIGEAAEGYMVAAISPDQTLIHITGPESVVNAVSYASVDISVAGATTNLSANVDINLYDAEDNLVSQEHIILNTDYVHMTVEVLATKVVPLEINHMGVPASGFMATGEIQSNPTNVTIAGTASALSNISSIVIPEERLSIAGESSDVSDTVNIREYLPGNVRLADSSFDGRVTVTIFIEPIEKKTLEIPSRNVRVTNLPEGYTATLPEELTTYTLGVSGLAEWITPLNQSAITGEINIALWMEETELTELTPGVHSIPVSFALSEDVIIDTPLSVRVTIEKNVEEE